MQNIDFSHRIARPNALKSGESHPFITEARRPFLTSGTLLFSVAILAFAVGILSGFQINRFSQAENSVIRYPEKDLRQEGSDRSAFANTAPTDSPSEVPSSAETTPATGSDRFEEKKASSDEHRDSVAAKGRYIIKIGTFSAGDADRITSKLNNVSEIAQTTPAMCEGIQESVPDRYLAFRSRAGSSESVFIGCFREEWKAREILELLKEKRLSGTGGARLFEIE